MRRDVAKRTIAVEYADEGLGFVWSDPVQLRQSILVIPALIRFLDEENPQLTVDSANLAETRKVADQVMSFAKQEKFEEAYGGVKPYRPLAAVEIDASRTPG